jgi:hypothetical protein
MLQTLRFFRNFVLHLRGTNIKALIWYAYSKDT